MTVRDLVDEIRLRGIWVLADGDRLRLNAPSGVLTPELREQLGQRKEEILEFLRGPSELSFSQQRLWFLDQIDSGGAAYVVGKGIQLQGLLDVSALERALGTLVARHEALRTVFEEVAGEAQQAVCEAGPWRLPVIEASGESAAQLHARLREEASRGFDLQRGPLFRTQLYRLGADRHVLLITMHHIVSDGWSMGILVRELSALYGAYVLNQEPQLPNLSMQYRDYARWQRGRLQGEVLDGMLSHWRERLAGAPQVLELPTDRVRPAVQSQRGAKYSFTLPLELTKELRTLSQREGATLFMTLLSGIALLLSRYSGQEDMLIGSPVANRNRAEIEDLVGCFINTLVLRAQADSELTVSAYLRRMREVSLDAFAHQELPFERLVEELQPERDMSRNPLFQVMFALQNAPMQPLELEGLTLSPIEIDAGGAQADLSLHLWETEQGLAGYINYATDLFDESSVARLGDHLHTLLEGMVSRPQTKLADLLMLTEPEREQLLVRWNDTQVEFDGDMRLHRMFEAQVERTPEKEALVCGTERLTYRELNRRANRLAHQLRALGAGPEKLVGVCLERTSELIVALLAVLKSGSAYVPLDPAYPGARNEFMLQDSQAVILVTIATINATLAVSAAQRLCIDQEVVADAYPETNPQEGAAADNLAYVIYTSGSTGVPKGVAIEHRNAATLAHWARTVFTDAEISGVLASTSVCFDLSVFEIFFPLTHGGRVILAQNALQLPEMPARQEVTLVNTVPSVAAELVRANALPDSVTTICLAGEPLSTRLVDQLYALNAVQRVYDLYGPSEDTTYSTYTLRQAGARATIGRPIANTRAYVLDAHMNPVPIGVSGELYLGGDGLARGYLGRAELNRERFVQNPFLEGTQHRLYRTGDLVRYLPDGQIEYLGRMDFQVKVRGFRIELGEIEAAIAKHEAIREVVVIAREDEPGDKRVVAYVVAEGESVDKDLSDTLRASLKEQLPAHMVPSAFVVLDALPLTPNKKIDRKALPVPANERDSDEPLVVPRSALEQRIAAIWCDLLQIDAIGVKDNFFDLGGHSLLLVKMHTRLCADLHCELRLVDLFTYPTIEALARHLGMETETTSSGEDARSRANRRRNASQTEPIAIIGMAGRFPGADTVEAFWSNLRAGKESIEFFSLDEMRDSGMPETILNDPNYVGARGYLKDADKFDATFFGYSAREADIMDPQHRLLLETASETLERAGYDPDRYDGLIGVYAGCSTNTYLSNSQSLHNRPGSVDGLSKSLGTGNDFLTTRISYKLNLRGPSLNVQTACSTSLVAVHQACRALWDYECDMVLAGGVSVTMPMKAGYVYVEQGIFSRDGHCRAFDANASGTLAGNGVALVMLKRLSEALADGDHIHSVILGTGINNDGSSKVGYTAPSVEGQANAIAFAQAVAQCDPDTIGYVEAHGTATAMGDPVEVSALTRVFGAGRNRIAPCWLGSVKTNIGHLDAAAGVAGLIKAAMSLENREIPPSLNYVEPNPEIDFAASPFMVNTELRPWESVAGTARRAGVSSFGLGGTNAHVVLEEPPAQESSAVSDSLQLLCLSAKSSVALDSATEELANHLSAHPDINLADAAYTLQIGRREFPHRRIIVCRDRDDATSVLDGNAPERMISGLHRAGDRSIVFTFSGQGAQYPNMGLGLYRNQRVFRDLVDECCEKLTQPIGLDLRKVLFPPDSKLAEAGERLKQTALTQPAIFVIEYALAKLWMSIGIQPAVMIGHSIGEYAAACLAGVMSLDDALSLVAERGRLMGQLPTGSMMAVSMSESEVIPLLGDKLSIAAINSPTLCVVSGSDREIGLLEAKLIKMDLAPRRLQTSHAFHSSMMDPILEPFTDRVRKLSLNPPRLPYISNVTGDWITTQQATDPAYYATHLRHAVKFAEGLEKLFPDSSRVFLEVGPGQTLSSLAKRHPGRKIEHACISSMRHPDDVRDDEMVFTENVGRLWLAGISPDWRAVHGDHRRRRVQLPTYPFQRQKHWFESSKEGNPLVPIDTPAKRSDINDWLYVPSWKRTPGHGGFIGQSSTSNRWLLFADESGWADALAKRLRSDGDSVVMVHAARRFERRDDASFTIDPVNEEHYESLFTAIRESTGVPIRIVHLWALTGAVEGGARTDDDHTILDRSFWSPTCIAKAIGRVAPGKSCDITFVTNGMQEVIGGEALSPEKATILGPCRVIPQEYPGVFCRSIDVVLPKRGTKGKKHLIDQLSGEVRSEATDPLVAFRGKYRWLPTFEPAPTASPEETTPRLRENGVYLVTGGLGGIGLTIAGFLAMDLSARLILVGRTNLPAVADWDGWLETRSPDNKVSMTIRKIRAIEQSGAQVMVESADVANLENMQRVVKLARQRFGVIHGVIHAAGVPAGGAIELKTRDAAAAILASKVEGTMILDRVFADSELDFMILCSSLTAVFGAGGQVDYTAANAFLDAFAQSKATIEKRLTVSIGWDAWSESGMAVNADVRAGHAEQHRRLLDFGIRDEEGIEVFRRILGYSLPNVAVSTTDLLRRIDQLHAREMHLSHGDQELAEEQRLDAHPRPELSTEYQAPGTEKEIVLANIWKEMLGISEVGIHDNFFELGGDSVLSIQIIAKANQAGLKLTPKQVFEHQTISELAATSGVELTMASEQHIATTTSINNSDMAEITRQLGTLQKPRT